ncbi:hypothetical protein [Variovorax paradoxus]|nr:hypothetical protein [Variovorax paradoxus]
MIALALLYRVGRLARRALVEAALFMLFLLGLVLAWAWRQA